MTLRPYQNDAIEALNTHLANKTNNPCVVLPTASGKSLVMAETIRRWKESCPSFRCVILAHRKELVDQNAKELRGIYPDGDIGIYAAGLGLHELDHTITFAGIDSVYDKSGHFKPFDVIIIDECFPAGTKVSTPRGFVNIEDVYVGQPVYNAIGTGNVDAISAKTCCELVEMELSNGTRIKCTPNHRLFTKRGWVRADSISIEDILFSRKEINGMWIEKGRLDELRAYRSKVLRMLRERDQAKMVRQKGFWKDETDDEAVLEQTSFLLSILRKESVKSDVDSGRARTGFRIFEEQREVLSLDGWKWNDDDKSSTQNRIHTWGVVQNGISDSDDEKSKGARSIIRLQDRCRNPVENDCNTTGWRESQNEKRKGCRQENDDVHYNVRVVGISRIKLESPVVVYNLQVAGHPSYYVDDILVHNCHRIPVRGEGKYRTFIADCRHFNPNVRVIGFTATPFRLGSGPVCHKDYILNEICYEANVGDLVRQGYLCTLRSKVSEHTPDLKMVKKSGGDYQQKALGVLMGRSDLVRRTVNDALAHLEDERRRNCVVWFCVDVQHCSLVENELRSRGESCASVTGGNSVYERDSAVDSFRDGRIRHLLNVNVFTEGFNVKQVDAVVLLRPTLSRSLYIQMVGRGMRLHPSKSDCLVLDYAHCIEEHGPIDAPYDGHVRVEICQKCREVFARGIRSCPKCGWEIPKQVIEERERVERERKMHEDRAAQLAILGSTPTQYPVSAVMVGRHEKNGIPSLCVTYRCGIQTFREWVCLDHEGYPKQKAERWWHTRFGEKTKVPSVDEALQDMFLGHEIARRTECVTVVRNGKYNEIISYKLKEVS